MDTKSVTAEGEDLAACGVDDGLLNALFPADATHKLLDDILDMCDDFLPRRISQLLALLSHTVTLPLAVALRRLKDILRFQRLDKAVVQADILFGGRSLGDGARDAKLPGSFLLAVHCERVEGVVEDWLRNSVQMARRKSQTRRVSD